MRHLLRSSKGCVKVPCVRPGAEPLRLSGGFPGFDAMAELDARDTEDITPAEQVSRDLHDVLQTLQANLAGILGSVLVDEEGFPLAWDLKGGADPTLIATAGALIGRGADRSAEVLDFGTPRNAILTTDKGSIGIFRVSARISLVVLLQPSTNNILVIVEVNKALERLRQVILPGF